MTLFDETAAQLLQRKSVATLRTGIHGIDEERGLFSGQILEVSGPHASGKTQLLMHIAMQCILPKRLGGLERIAVFIDLDGKFEGHRFFPALEDRLHKAEWADIEQMKTACLERFYYIRCDSSFDFLCILKTLPRILEKKKLLNKVGCLLIDNLMAYCWSDKAREIGISDANNVPMTFPRVQQSVFAEFEKILQSMRIFIVVSKFATTEVRMDAKGQPQWDQRELVQHRLQMLYSQRLILVPAVNLSHELRNTCRCDKQGVMAKWMNSDSPPFQWKGILQD